MERNIIVVSLLVEERVAHAPEVQGILTRYGKQILNRSGIPAPSKDKGIITLVMVATEQERLELEKSLQQVNGVQVRTVSFGLDAKEFQCSLS